MRTVSFGLVILHTLSAGLSGCRARRRRVHEGMPGHRDPEDVRVHIVRRCPADKRAAAIAGMRKSNASTQPGGNLLDPSTLSPEQMQGLDAVVIAQASCM